MAERARRGCKTGHPQGKAIALAAMAQYLGVDMAVVSRLIKSERIPFYQTPAGKVLVKIDDFNWYFAACGEAGGAGGAVCER